MRIAVRLSSAVTGESIWAQHYDRPVEDLFEVQDEVAHLVAAAVARLLEIEINARSGAKPPASLSSYEHILHGHWHFRKLTIASNLEARASFESAHKIDPRNAEAMSWLGATYSNNWLNAFALDDARRGADLCAEAVNLDPADAHCHAMLGFAELCVGNLDAAVRASDRAVQPQSRRFKCTGQPELCRRSLKAARWRPGNCSTAPSSSTPCHHCGSGVRGPDRLR